jgi:hypothetical protein
MKLDILLVAEPSAFYGDTFLDSDDRYGRKLLFELSVD